jgi:4-hydroxybenzoate polyprenyltransferase
MLALSLWAAIGLGSSFLVVMGIYFALMIGYCVILKQLIVLDAMTIASGFVLRVVGGAIAVQVKPTHWLIACAFLLALYLAFAKRRQELLTLSDTDTRHRQVLDSYTVSYLDQVNNILIGATVVCYALYTVAPETVERFGTDSLIYGTLCNIRSAALHGIDSRSFQWGRSEQDAYEGQALAGGGSLLGDIQRRGHLWFFS